MTRTEEQTATLATSPDGTPIAYWTSGKGPPLVVVHGGTADHTRWRPVLPLLEPHVTVVALDRRGRGASGDSTGYHIEWEFDDVAAVVEAVAQEVSGPVHLLGHSFGGNVALGAATRTNRLDGLLLYEPAIEPGPDAFPPGMLERVEELLAAGEPELMLETFFREAVQMPEHELQAFRALPAWQARVAAAHTLPRELRAVIDGTGFEPDRIATVGVPTLLLLGGDSPATAQRETEAVAAALPDARIEVLEGQQHIAIDTAPAQFAAAVLAFLQLP